MPGSPPTTLTSCTSCADHWCYHQLWKYVGCTNGVCNCCRRNPWVGWFPTDLLPDGLGCGRMSCASNKACPETSPSSCCYPHASDTVNVYYRVCCNAKSQGSGTHQEQGCNILWTEGTINDYGMLQNISKYLQIICEISFLFSLFFFKSLVSSVGRWYIYLYLSIYIS